jgi:hypothetical protein
MAHDQRPVSTAILPLNIGFDAMFGFLWYIRKNFSSTRFFAIVLQISARCWEELSIVSSAMKT